MMEDELTCVIYWIEWLIVNGWMEMWIEEAKSSEVSEERRRTVHWLQCTALGKQSGKRAGKAQEEHEKLQWSC